MINFKSSVRKFNRSHTIINLKHDVRYKPYEVRTDMGFGPIKTYLKIIKREHQVKSDKPFVSVTWQEI